MKKILLLLSLIMTTSSFCMNSNKLTQISVTTAQQEPDRIEARTNNGWISQKEEFKPYTILSLLLEINQSNAQSPKTNAASANAQPTAQASKTPVRRMLPPLDLTPALAIQSAQANNKAQKSVLPPAGNGVVVFKNAARKNPVKRDDKLALTSPMNTPTGINAPTSTQTNTKMRSEAYAVATTQPIMHASTTINITLVQKQQPVAPTTPKFQVQTTRGLTTTEICALEDFTFDRILRSQVESSDRYFVEKMDKLALKLTNQYMLENPHFKPQEVYQHIQSRIDTYVNATLGKTDTCCVGCVIS